MLLFILLLPFIQQQAWRAMIFRFHPAENIQETDKIPLARICALFWLVVSTDFRLIFDQNQTWFRPIFLLLCKSAEVSNSQKLLASVHAALVTAVFLWLCTHSIGMIYLIWKMVIISYFRTGEHRKMLKDLQTWRWNDPKLVSFCFVEALRIIKVQI